MKDPVEIYEQYIAANGQRKTPERIAILKEIYTINDHFDVEMLHKRMQDKNYLVSKATLYNTIEHLLACRLVRKHQFGNGQAMYEKSLSSRQHDHIIRTDTSEVLEFCDPRIETIKATIEEVFNVKVTGHSLYFYAEAKDE